MFGSVLYEHILAVASLTARVPSGVTGMMGIGVVEMSLVAIFPPFAGVLGQATCRMDCDSDGSGEGIA